MHAHFAGQVHIRASDQKADVQLVAQHVKSLLDSAVARHGHLQAFRILSEGICQCKD